MEYSWKKLMDGNGDELFFVEFHNLKFIYKIWKYGADVDGVEENLLRIFNMSLQTKSFKLHLTVKESEISYILIFD